MPQCPICKSAAEEIDRGVFDGVGFDCRRHGRFTFSHARRVHSREVAQLSRALGDHQGSKSDPPFRARVAVCLGGTVAQAMFNASTNDKSGTADQLMAAVMMETLDDKTCTALVHAGKQHAEAVLRQYEKSVHRVAQHLTEKPVMDKGTFVRMLLGS